MPKVVRKFYRDGVEYKIKFDTGWKPGADTITYLPLNGDIVDKTGNYTYTLGSGASLDSSVLSGKTVLHVSGSGINGLYSTANSPTFDTNNSYTVSCWSKAYSSTSTQFIFTTGMTATAKGFSLYRFYENGSYKGYAALYVGGTIELPVNYNPGTDWHLYTMVFSNKTIKVYIDGTLFTSGGSVSSGSSASGYPIRIGTNQGASGRGANNNGYYSELIREQKEWTADDITKYFNQTKSNYGL